MIETPKNSPNKFAFDPKQRVFVLKKCCRQGWCFPMTSVFCHRRSLQTATHRRPAFDGRAGLPRVCCGRPPLGVIEGEQFDGKKRIRNDRLMAVAEANHTYAYLKKLKDLPVRRCASCRTFS